MQKIQIIYPDDWHCHLRDGPLLGTTVPLAAKQFKRAIVMPNLKPPVTTVSLAQQYYERILSFIPEEHDFTPLMTLYLTDQTTPGTIKEAKESGIIYGCKLYPAGATTNSESGVTKIDKIFPVLEAMSKYKIPLQIHGEVTETEVDIFDRESVFIDQILQKIVNNFPDLKIILEHITTSEAVQFIEQNSALLAATITPHHLMLNRNALFVGGIQPHHYCLPVLKRKKHQEALLKAATSGNPKFFIGTDSAPHAKSQKENACGCAGVYNHLEAIAIYAEIFEKENALDKLEGFTSKFGAAFYGLPYNSQKLTLIKQNITLPLELPYGEETIIPFMAGKTLSWQAISEIK